MPIPSASRPTPHRSTAIRLIIAAIIAMIIGSLIPPLIIDARTQVPLGQSSTFATAPTEAQVLNLGALAAREVPAPHATDPACADPASAGLACFQTRGQTTFDRVTTTSTAPTRSEVIVDSHLTVRFEGERVAEITDHVQLDRASALPVEEPVAYLTLTIPALAADVTSVPSYRDGISHLFPPTTERRSYPYFDKHTSQSTPIDYVDEHDLNGITVNTYAQSLRAINLVDAIARTQHAEAGLPENGNELQAALEQAITSYRPDLDTVNALLTGPAEDYIDEEERELYGVAADEVVQPAPYYSVDRVLTVEPDTGVILDTEETFYLYFAVNQAQAEAMAQQPPHPARTLFYAETRWDDATRQAQLDRVSPTLQLLRALQIIAWLFSTAAFLLLAAAVVTIVRMRDARREQLLAVAP